MNFNFAKVILEKNKHKQQIVYEDNYTSITFDQLYLRVKKTAHYLSDRGLKTNDRVVLLLTDSIDSIVIYFAVIYAGGIAVVCNPRARQQTIDYQIQNIDPALVIAEKDYNNGLLSSQIVENYNNYTDEFEAVHKKHDDVLSMFWTSGTSNYAPRAVMYSHGRMVETVKGVADGFRFGSADRIYCTSKTSFLYSFVVSIHNVLWNGGQAFIDDGLSVPSRVQKNIESFKPTMVFSVPAIYAGLLSVGYANPRVVQYWSAGDFLSQKLIDQFSNITKQGIHNNYGCHELSGMVIINHGYTPSVGQTVLPGYKIRIVDEDGGIAPNGSIGIMQVDSDVKGVGYWNSDSDSSIFNPGWVNTGDMAYRTDSGEIYLVCRVGDVIKIRGQLMNPNELEEIIQKHDCVDQVTVVAVPTEMGITQLEAFVILAAGENISPTELKTWIKSRCEHYLCPSIIHIVDDFPRNENGKIQRFKLRETI